MANRSAPVIIRTPVRERMAASAAFLVVAVASLAPQFLGHAGVTVPTTVRLGCGAMTVLCLGACAFTFRGGYVRVDDARVVIKRPRSRRTIARADVADVVLGQGPGFDQGKVTPALVLRSGHTLKLTEFASPRHEHAHHGDATIAGQTVQRLRAVLIVPEPATQASDAA